jgi:hypothetical protein
MEDGAAAGTVVAVGVGATRAGCASAIGVVSTAGLLHAASSATSTRKTKDLRTLFQLTILLYFACVQPEIISENRAGRLTKRQQNGNGLV